MIRIHFPRHVHDSVKAAIHINWEMIVKQTWTRRAANKKTRLTAGFQILRGRKA